MGTLNSYRNAGDTLALGLYHRTAEMGKKGFLRLQPIAGPTIGENEEDLFPLRTKSQALRCPANCFAVDVLFHLSATGVLAEGVLGLVEALGEILQHQMSEWDRSPISRFPRSFPPTGGGCKPKDLVGDLQLVSGFREQQRQLNRQGDSVVAPHMEPE